MYQKNNLAKKANELSGINHPLDRRSLLHATWITKANETKFGSGRYF
jgi:hypothetical protein